MGEKNGDTRTMEELHAEVQARLTELNEAAERERVASSKTSQARNSFNEACKRFDAKVAEIRKSAPWNTDWSNERERRPMRVADSA